MPEILFSDVERAVRDRDPHLGELLCSYLEQDDPEPGRPEVDERPDDEGDLPEIPDDQWTLPKLSQALRPDKLRGLSGTEQKARRKEAWEGLLAAPNPPPRLKLGKMLLDLYAEGDEGARAALRHVFLEGKLCWGVWQGAKAIYKLAEERIDVEMLGVLGYRLDALGRTSYARDEIGDGTALYMRRRVWRFLRLLGAALPSVYVELAVQVLRHYPSGTGFYSVWVPGQIWNHKNLVGGTGRSGSGFRDVDAAAFPDAWKASATPALRLLEDAQADDVCGFAIAILKKHFPEIVRRPDAAWLARLGHKRLGAVDAFIVETLKASPELHQSKLRGLGLHDLVIGLLDSQDDDARAYAVEYATAHAPDLPAAKLVKFIVDDVAEEVKAFAFARLKGMSVAQIGLGALARLIGTYGDASEWAAEQLRGNVRPASIDRETFLLLWRTCDESREALEKIYEAAKEEIPTDLLKAAIDDKEGEWDSIDRAKDLLGERAGEVIGFGWAQAHIAHDQIDSDVQGWIQAGKWKGDALDVDWLKELVGRAKHRSFALGVLRNRELVSPARLGLTWLLETARRPEEDVRTFAESALLEAFAPEDFAPGQGLEAGLDRLFDLAAGPKQPDPVRAFAALYLKLHHPDISPGMPEARQHSIKPRLGHDSFAARRVLPLLEDARVDVRRLGISLARHELGRWGDPLHVYRMAESAHAETRSAGCELLLGANETPETTVPLGWLEPARVFALAESANKVCRETALTLVRRHYDRLADATRLAWLMESPDRDVQLAAVRLLWERHRPRPTPPGWKPRGRELAVPVGTAPFESDVALAAFLRAVLFGLPPGRMERRDLPGGAGGPDRALPASVAKRRVVDAVRDLAVEDEGFARIVAAVLSEFVVSTAKGEWQGCVAALAVIRHAHPGLAVPVLPAEKLAKPQPTRQGA